LWYLKGCERYGEVREEQAPKREWKWHMQGRIGGWGVIMGKGKGYGVLAGEKRSAREEGK